MSEKSDKELTVREVRATYDGKVFVPMEALDLPVGQQLTLHFEVEGEGPKPGTPEAVRKAVGIIDAPWFDPRKIDRDDIYP